VEVSGEVRLDLPLVVGEEDVIEVQAVAREVNFEAFPDRHDLRVVGDRAQQESVGIAHCRLLTFL
jgi:hypothetical protein